LKRKNVKDCVNDLLLDLESFGVFVEVDDVTFEVLGVDCKWQHKST